MIIYQSPNVPAVLTHDYKAFPLLLPGVFIFFDQPSWDVSSEVLYQASYYFLTFPLSARWSYLSYIIDRIR